MTSVSVPPKPAQLGLMGLGVMGENLALNIEHDAPQRGTLDPQRGEGGATHVDVEGRG